MSLATKVIKDVKWVLLLCDLLLIVWLFTGKFNSHLENAKATSGIEVSVKGNNFALSYLLVKYFLNTVFTLLKNCDGKHSQTNFSLGCYELTFDPKII